MGCDVPTPRKSVPGFWGPGGGGAPLGTAVRLTLGRGPELAEKLEAGWGKDRAAKGPSLPTQRIDSEAHRTLGGRAPDF